MTTVTAQATNVAVKVTGRGKPSGRVRTWRVGTDCSKYGQQQQGRPDHRRSTAVYDGHSTTVRKRNEGVSGSRNRPCTRAHRRESREIRRTTLLSRAYTCTQEQQSWTRSSPALSASTYLSNLAVGLAIQLVRFRRGITGCTKSIAIHTTAGIPSPADAHFLIHCCRVSIPFCSMPFAMKAPSVTWPVGASTTAVKSINIIRHKQRTHPGNAKYSFFA